MIEDEIDPLITDDVNGVTAFATAPKKLADRKKKRMDKLQEMKDLLEATYDKIEYAADMFVSYINPYATGSWKSISEAEIVEAQQFRCKELNLEVQETVMLKEGKIWIPRQLVERFLIQLHIVLRHPPLFVILDHLKKYLLEMPEGVEINDVLKVHAHLCIHCTRRPMILMRSYEQTFAATKAREVLHLDYLYMVNHTYLLV